MHTVAAIQMHSNHCLDDNLAAAKKLIHKAKHCGAQLIVLPEMFVMHGLSFMDKVQIKEPFGQGKIQDFLAKAAKDNQAWIVGGTIPIACEDETKVRAACLLYNDQGDVVARYDKAHLFDAVLTKDGKTKQILESSATEPGNEIVIADTPFGKLGLAVCYDLRFPEMFRTMFNRGAEIIAVPTAFVKTTGQMHWHALTHCRAIENFSYLIGACQDGKLTNGHDTYGHSVIIDPWGKTLSELKSGAGVITAQIDLNYLKDIRTNMPVMQHQKFFKTQ